MNYSVVQGWILERKLARTFDYFENISGSLDHQAVKLKQSPL